MFFNNFVNYANVVAGIVAFIVAILILAKDASSTVNWLFFGSMSAWGISLALNGFTFLFEDPTPGANVVRDFVTGLGSVAAFLIFGTAIVMLKGEYFIKKPYFLIPFTLACIANTIISVYFDEVVYDSPDGLTPGNGIKTTQKPWVMIFVYLVPLLLIITSNILFHLTKRDIKDKLVRRRINYFIIGFSFIVIGAVIYSSSGIIEQLFTTISYEVELAIFIIAELFWVTGPVLMLIGHYLGRITLRHDVDLETD